MIPRHPRSTRSDTLVPDPTLFRGGIGGAGRHAVVERGQRPVVEAAVALQPALASLFVGQGDAPRRKHQGGDEGHGEGDQDGAVEPAVERRQRSEEYTSELQSLMRNSYAVFCLKKKNTKK